MKFLTGGKNGNFILKCQKIRLKNIPGRGVFNIAYRGFPCLNQKENKTRK